MDIERIAAFSDGDRGGNPAGVVITDVLPPDDEMRRVAAMAGYSETAFAAPLDGGWRVRYFSPESEVPFCGHATIALGAALAARFGDAVYRLTLNDARISVEGRGGGDALFAALQSPPTRSAAAPADRVAEALALFRYAPEQLDERIPPAVIHAGADHFLLALKSREALRAMHYDLDAGRSLMRRHALVTIVLVWSETSSRFHTRNPFASGGVYEDPATGAATAALAGYLRDLEWPHGGAIDVVQGEDMGSPSLLRAEIPPERGTSIRVSGTARRL